MAERRDYLGPYELGPQLAAGSSAAVFLGIRSGPLGFRRVVAIKRLHSELARDPDAVAMLLQEGRLAAQLRHPLVVPALDVVDGPRGLALVTEYVDGLSLSALRNEAWPPPLHVALAIVCDVCTALTALHTARGHNGEPLGIVHRDVSPKNVLVGADGYARLIDLGVAKAHRRAQQSVDGEVKGTLAYLAPEQIDGRGVDARTDVFAVGVLAWELLTGERAFAGAPLSTRALSAERLAPPSSVRAGVPAELDALVRRAIAPEPGDRYPDAASFAEALTLPRAQPREVAAWVEEAGHATLAERRAMVRELAAEDASLDEGSTATVDGPARPTPTPQRRKKPGQRTPWLVLTLLLALGAGWSLAQVTRIAPSTAAPTTSAVATTPTSAATTPTSGAATPSAVPAPSAVTAPSAPPPVVSVAPPFTTAPTPKSKPSASAKVVTDACSPPYTTDERGVRKFKVECL